MIAMFLSPVFQMPVIARPLAVAIHVDDSLAKMDCRALLAMTNQLA
jgi:hypothetical protein